MLTENQQLSRNFNENERVNIYSDCAGLVAAVVVVVVAVGVCLHRWTKAAHPIWNVDVNMKMPCYDDEYDDQTC